MRLFAASTACAKPGATNAARRRCERPASAMRSGLTRLREWFLVPDPGCCAVRVRGPHRGVYVEGSLALLTTNAGSTDMKKHPDASPEAIEMSAPFDLKLGVGYRVPLGANDKVSTTGLDIRLGVDLGQFTKLEYESVGGDVEGEIASEKRALHVAVGIGVRYHFAP